MTLPRAPQLLPHEGESILLDEILGVGERGLTATVAARPGCPYGRDDGGLPGYSGVEAMAQAVSAFATLQSGPPYRPRPGLLLGIRSYRGPAEFPGGVRLLVEVRESTRDGAGYAVFDGHLERDGRRVAEGTLTVFQPEDAREALGEQLE